MDWQLFTSFEGRISRSQFWIGILLVVLAQLVLQFIFSRFLGTPSFVTGHYVDPQALLANKLDREITSLVVEVIIAFPTISILIKRLHDREKTAKWLLIYFVLPFILAIPGLFGLTWQAFQLKSGQYIGVPTIVGGICMISSLAVLVTMLIDLGAIRGTAGSNRFGSDPLAPNTK